MVSIPRIVFFAFLILFMVASAFSQKKADPKLLADNATIDDIKNWMSDNLPKFSKYPSSNDLKTISAPVTEQPLASTSRKLERVTFEGTVLNAKVKASIPIQQAGSDLVRYEIVSFDLKDIDPASVSITAFPRNDKIMALSMTTINQKESISEWTTYGRSDKAEAKDARASSTIYFYLEKDSTEYCKTVFVRLIKLSQTEK